MSRASKYATCSNHETEELHSVTVNFTATFFVLIFVHVVSASFYLPAHRLRDEQL